ncbi:GGDEF domain-containing protein [Dactylosporangium sp. NPDC005555]|uniref:GGDEF domain-containing protein n=1 Tax=Dactylosporangium sp. NPDC005555 TaxID=3154889 RepID=UPI0033ABD513
MLPVVLAVVQLLPLMCGAVLLLQFRHSFTGTVAAFAGVAVFSVAAGFCARRWYVRAAVAAVRAAVRQEAQDAALAAARDPLTGLPTRAALEVALADADASGAPFTVALIDVDGLHDVNSRWGHAAGDQYLAAIAGRLAAAVPAQGRIIRQGGDELTVVVAGSDAAGLGDRITAALAAPATVAGRRLPLRASAGIAVGGTTGTTASTTAGTSAATTAGTAAGVSGDARYVLACADAAMYSAKDAGGGQMLLYRADRDGRPALDGTRPAVRRRDSRPAPDVDVPGSGGRRLPVYLTGAERHLLRRLLHDVTAYPGDVGLQARLRSIAGRLTPSTGGR